MPIKLVERFGCERNVLEFHEAHRPILLSPEAETLVPSLLGEHGLQFILRCVNGEVADIKRIAWRILVRRVDWRIIVSRIMLGVSLIARVGP